MDMIRHANLAGSCLPQAVGMSLNLFPHQLFGETVVHKCETGRDAHFFNRPHCKSVAFAGWHCGCRGEVPEVRALRLGHHTQESTSESR